MEHASDALTKVDAFLAFATGGSKKPDVRRDLRRGEVYKIAYDQPARRVVIVSSDEINSADRDFVKVVMITNTAPPHSAAGFSVDVSTLANTGALTGFVMGDSLTSLSRSYFAGLSSVHAFSGRDLAKINAALKAALGISASA
jgi:mRNA-degrading endonuclease toxin of MazEF toxin-antitoxin module